LAIVAVRLSPNTISKVILTVVWDSRLCPKDHFPGPSLREDGKTRDLKSGQVVVVRGPKRGTIALTKGRIPSGPGNSFLPQKNLTLQKGPRPFLSFSEGISPHLGKLVRKSFQKPRVQTNSDSQGCRPFKKGKLPNLGRHSWVKPNRGKSIKLSRSGLAQN